MLFSFLLFIGFIYAVPFGCPSMFHALFLSISNMKGGGGLIYDCLLETNLCSGLGKNSPGADGECYGVTVGDIFLNTNDGKSNFTVYTDRVRYVDGKTLTYFETGVNDYTKVLPSGKFVNYFCACVQNKTEFRLKCTTPGSCFKLINP